MKKNLLLVILFLLAVPLVFVPAESKGADTTPPTFGGVYNSAYFGANSIYLDWPDEATDESPPITYNIYWSTVSGGQNFSYAAFFAARRLIHPIQQLMQGTRAVARGDYETKVPLSQGDEIGFLVSSFTRRVKAPCWLSRENSSSTRSR